MQAEQLLEEYAADSEAENEISIPQESSIAGSISMQH